MAKSRFRFSKKNLRELPVPEKGYEFHYDSAVPRLAVRVSHTGRRTFLFTKSRGGKQVIKTQDLDAARTFVRSQEDAAAMGGGSAVAVAGWTFRQLFDHWMEFRAKPFKRTWKRDESRFKQYLTQWSSRRLDKITPAEVVALHVEIGRDSGHYAANDTLGFVSSLYTYASGPELGWRESVFGDSDVS